MHLHLLLGKECLELNPDTFMGEVGPSHEPPRPSEAEIIAARASDAIFGTHWNDDQSPFSGDGSGNGGGQ